jgi:hypothetical protein
MESSWRNLTGADVLGVCSEPEKTAYEIAATGAGQDVMAQAIGLVVDQCRGYIADNAQNKLAAGTTLPKRCHLAALHLIRVELLTRLDIEVSKDREGARRDALRFFERVADGRVNLEQPEGDVDARGPLQKITVLSNNERQATRQNLAGL